MPLLSESVEDKKFDVRMVEKNLARARVQMSEVDAVVRALPDDAENAEWITLEAIEAQSREEAPGLSHGA